MSEEQLVYKKKKKKFKIFPIVNVIFFILVSLLILFPMWKVIVDSFDAHSATSFRWWPSTFSLGGYGAIISRASLYRTHSVGNARKKLLRIYVIIHNDFRWWYGS